MTASKIIRINGTIAYRTGGDWGVDAAYLKGTARIYPEQWTLSEMRLILADMEKRDGEKTEQRARAGEGK